MKLSIVRETGLALFSLVLRLIGTPLAEPGATRMSCRITASQNGRLASAACYPLSSLASLNVDGGLPYLVAIGGQPTGSERQYAWETPTGNP